MTNPQKEKIALMRSDGASYIKIAEALGISANTVKSYCQRNGVGGEESRAKKVCEQCRQALKYSSQPSRRFCCDACRMAWWKAHPKKLNRKAVYHFKCAVCKKAFTAYGNANRKYCSRKCYGKSKAAGTRLVVTP